MRDSYGWFRVVQGVKTMLKLDRQTCSCKKTKQVVPPDFQKRLFQLLNGQVWLHIL